MTYKIQLPQFEGPFDLLLFFIERDELDIYDIPISRITKEFLDYLHQLQALNIEVASEFILVAATLMKIKSRMLLPRREVDESGEEIDPRQELIDRLLEYKKYKSAVEDLRKKEEEQEKKLARGYAKTEIEKYRESLETEIELGELTLYKLFQAFSRAMDRFEKENRNVEHKIVRYNYTISEQKISLKNYLKDRGEVAFEKILLTCRDRLQFVFSFLALLEMIQHQDISLKLGEGPNNFWLKLNREDEKAA